VSDTSTLISQAYQLDGTDAPDEIMNCVIEMTVETSLHLPDIATINVSRPQLKLVDDARLAPGKRW
jgi:hypothetical protein